MKTRALVLTLGIVMLHTLASCFAGENSKEQRAAVKRDMNRLQGEWVLTEMGTRRKSSMSHVMPSTFDGKLVIKGDTGKVSVLIQGHKLEYSYRLQLDPTKNPKHYDEIIPNEPASEGVYELTGNTLKQCISPEIGGCRPRSFEYGQYFVWKRKKAMKEDHDGSPTSDSSEFELDERP